jgi:hypothetical protein
VPGKLFWSVTAYDAQTRSQIQNDEGRAILSSLFDFGDVPADADSVTLHFGPERPEGDDIHWIQTLPGRGWFVYFRIYGPEEAAFDKSWSLPDFHTED